MSDLVVEITGGQGVPAIVVKPAHRPGRSIGAFITDVFRSPRSADNKMNRANACEPGERNSEPLQLHVARPMAIVPGPVNFAEIMRVRRTFAIGPMLLVLPACTMLPRDITAPVPPAPPTHVVFVADGAGIFDRHPRHSERRPRPTAGPWMFARSSGRTASSGISPTTPITHGRDRGRESAGLVLAQKQAHPDMPVSLVGHSAGCYVVLVAASSCRRTRSSGLSAQPVRVVRL